MKKIKKRISVSDVMEFTIIGKKLYAFIYSKIYKEFIDKEIEEELRY
jgi:hypothetical protein